MSENDIQPDETSEKLKSHLTTFQQYEIKKERNFTNFSTCTVVRVSAFLKKKNFMLRLHKNQRLSLNLKFNGFSEQTLKMLLTISKVIIV